MNKQLLNWAGWILVALVVGLWFYKNPANVTQLPTPGQEFSAVTGTCWGAQVLEYGRPNYGGDPLMQHMAGHPCYTYEQCWKWHPVNYTLTTNQSLYCCVPTGTCVVNEEEIK